METDTLVHSLRTFQVDRRKVWIQHEVIEQNWTLVSLLPIKEVEVGASVSEGVRLTNYPLLSRSRYFVKAHVSDRHVCVCVEREKDKYKNSSVKPSVLEEKSEIKQQSEGYFKKVNNID